MIVTGFSKGDLENRTKSKISTGKKVKAIVAFVDLLGFSIEVLKNWKDNSDDFLHRIMKIKSFVELCKEKAVYSRFYDFDNIKLLATTEYPKIITFSDSFIFIKEIDETNFETKIASVFSVVASIHELWKFSIDESFTLRGAIDFGEFFYDKNEIIGPAYISAYKSESTIAGVSRIICSDSIGNIINENIQHVHDTLVKYCQLWFKLDIDNKLIINPLVAFNLDSTENMDSALERLENMRLSSNDHSARSKYHDLIEQLIERKINYSDLQIFNPKNNLK